MKKIIILVTVTSLFLSYSIADAQLKVISDGSVEIKSYTPDWGRAISTEVFYPNSCAYHLTYGPTGKDVFYVCAQGWLWCEKGGWFGSDIKLKRNIRNITNPLGIIRQLHGVEFSFRNDSTKDLKGNTIYQETSDSGRVHIGLIAQEVESILPNLVRNINGTKAVSYLDLIALIIEAIKEQQNKIETLQTIVYSQEQELISIQDDINNCCNNYNNTMLKSNKPNDKQSVSDSLQDGAKLYQNIPNPYNKNTEINFIIPKNSNFALIIIHDMQGKEIKSYHINQKGFSNIIINGSELNAGMYLYTLIVDNKIIDTKRMILTKD